MVVSEEGEGGSLAKGLVVGEVSALEVTALVTVRPTRRGNFRSGLAASPP